MGHNDYGYTVRTALDYAAAVAAVTAALKQEGFGVLTTIDMQATFKAKLGADIAPYLILGACNPPLAQQALAIEPELGLLLPCNVIVYRDDAGQTIVSAINPEAMFSIVRRDELTAIAQEVGARLRRAMAALPVVAGEAP
ncbi:MAG: DUF302 domain-containing protein [Chloroflexales bacterium]|nr:DUF302 domain-containing protein [Chloroflexales bacterium]